MHSLQVQRQYVLYQHLFKIYQSVSSVQSLRRVQLFATTWIAARQASLSITNARSSPKLMCLELVMPSSHLILCRPLLLLPPEFSIVCCDPLRILVLPLGLLHCTVGSCALKSGFIKVFWLTAAALSNTELTYALTTRVVPVAPAMAALTTAFSSAWAVLFPAGNPAT